MTLRTLLTVCVACWLGAAAADTLQVSRAYEEETPGTIMMTLRHQEIEGELQNEDLWISKKVIFSEGDIVRAFPPPDQKGVIFISLTVEAGRRLEKVTNDLKLGEDRMAVVLNGKLISAPVVMSKLSTSVAIPIPLDLKEGDLQRLAGSIVQAKKKEAQKAKETGVESDGGGKGVQSR